MNFSIPKNWKLVMHVAWPLILANSFWNLQMTIDRIFLGNFSTQALGASVTVMCVFWTPMALLQQTASYVTTFVAQYFGAGKFQQIGPSVWQGIYVSIVGGLLFLLLIFISPSFFGLVGHSDQLLQYEIEYFNSICFSALPMALVAVFSGFFTGLNNTRWVMAMNALGLFINAILDYLLIFGNWGFPKLGIAGAGYATAISATLSALYGAYLVFKKKYRKEFNLNLWGKIEADLLLRFLKFGLPSGLQFAFEGLAFTFFLIIMGQFTNGEAALSASGIAVTIMLISILPTFGVAQAVMSVVGQQLGQEQPDQAQKTFWAGAQIAGLFVLFISSSMVLFPHFYLSWFANPSDIELWSQVSAMVPTLLIFVAIYTALDSMNAIFSMGLKGAGDTRFVSLVVMILPWPLMIAPMYLIKNHAKATYWAWGFSCLYICVQALIFFLRFQQGRWKSMKVI